MIIEWKLLKVHVSNVVVVIKWDDFYIFGQVSHNLQGSLKSSTWEGILWIMCLLSTSFTIGVNEERKIVKQSKLHLLGKLKKYIKDR